MDLGTKSKHRRQEIRKNRPDTQRMCWQEMKARGIPQAIAIAFGFFLISTSILMFRQDVVHYRPDQPITHDIVSRVDFDFYDSTQLQQAQMQARQREPRVYVADDAVWDDLKKDLLSLPERMSAVSGQPTTELSAFDDAGARTALRQAGSPEGAAAYAQQVGAFVDRLRDYRNATSQRPLMVLAPDGAQIDLRRRYIRVGSEEVDVSSTLTAGDRRRLLPIIQELASQNFPVSIQTKMAEYTLVQLRPTHKLDIAATTQRENQAAQTVPASAGARHIAPNQAMVLRTKGYLDYADWLLLRAENQAYVSSLKGSAWKQKLGILTATLVLTLVMSAYVAAFQPRIVKNTARAAAIAGLLLAMLLLAGLAGVGNGPVHLFGTAPTLLVAMILAIAYDRRFAIGIATMHGLLVTIALDQSAAFFLILWVGVLVAGFLLDDVRTRSKLIEVSGAASIAMIVATAASGLLELESGTFVFRNCCYAGAAGLAVGFVVLGILPFIERSFRITTSMTLLELADASQPLLRRLQAEAPGTYNHSLQVANLAESAAEAIGANSMLCRVAAYYHDVGKINKPDYFVENQTDGPNRHLNLDPNLSLLIIVGHVKDGVELAREYNLPTSIIPFIQQHHGTTVVEYFYRRACTQQEQRDPSMPAVSETQFRYPGPRPRTKEVAIVMLSDVVESATRAMDDPSPAQIEGLVRDLAMRRLLDGQFDECDLTMKDLERIKRALVKTIAGMYHGRIPYPAPATPQSQQSTAQTSVDLSQDVRSA